MEVSAVTSMPDAVRISKQAEALSLTAGVADQATPYGKAALLDAIRVQPAEQVTGWCEYTLPLPQPQGRQWL